MSAIDALAMPSRTPWRWLGLRLALATAMAGLADWLFYDHAIGISLALFLGALGMVAIAVNPVRAGHRARVVACILFGAALLALIEDVSILSVAFDGFATLLFVLIMIAGENARWAQYVYWASTLPFAGPFWLTSDILRARKLGRREHNATQISNAMLIAWIVPLTLLVVFLSLFASANPLIEDALAMLSPSRRLEAFDARRALFWVGIAIAIWPLIHLRLARWRAAAFRAASAPALDANAFAVLFGKAAILRSLVLFNALFALQTGLDLAYLWGGLALPDGVTYAAYAHRGAYPLIATALLAAGFVLIAMRPQGPAKESQWIRPLVLIWTGQNLALVFSSILRTNLYVAAYSLTYLRLAALIWMALVAIGLILILAQIAFNKPNSWLLVMNAAALALTLYACCFLNAPYVIASYNIAHCEEVRGAGPILDLPYLLSLGSQTYPAFDDPELRKARYVDAHRLQLLGLAGAGYSDDWRGWTFRGWRLQNYFAKHTGDDSAVYPGAASRNQP
jgi:uncharacterized protein DUF4153